ncbi:hypothetical protein [Streptomyces sp. NPDC001889]
MAHRYEHPAAATSTVSIARLHGEACWHCGTVAGQLAPAGTVVLPGRRTPWPVVSCGCVPTAFTIYRVPSRGEWQALAPTDFAEHLSGPYVVVCPAGTLRVDELRSALAASIPIRTSPATADTVPGHGQRTSSGRSGAST